jgi:hypothetical protein
VVVEPRHGSDADGGGEAFPQDKRNHLEKQENLPREKDLDRQILFLVLFAQIKRVLSQPLTTAVIGSGGG